MIAGTGDYADRAAFLRQVELNAPAVLEHLARLYRASLDPDLRAWASTWNLARAGRGEWILSTADKTLRMWRRYDVTRTPDNLRPISELGFTLPAGISATSIQPGAPDPAEYLAGLKKTRVSLRTLAQGVRLEESPAPVGRVRDPGARVKKRMLDTIKWLPRAEDRHLIELVQWQVLRMTPLEIFDGEQRASDTREFRRRMHELQLRLDLPDRHRSSPHP